MQATASNGLQSDSAMADVVPTLVSTITCPQCGHATVETMPTDACQFYDCKYCVRYCGCSDQPLL